MAACELCGKGPVSGFNVSHSKRHTNRKWQPNTHRAIIYVKGKPKRMNVCTRCLRSQYKLKD